MSSVELVGDISLNTVVDVFPLSFDMLRFPIVAYVIKSENAQEIGATYAARVRKMRQMPCAWVRKEQRLITPKAFAPKDATTLLQELQGMKLDGFDFVEGIELDPNWQPSPNEITQFIVRGVFDAAKGVMAAALKDEVFSKGIITVEREPILKGVVVHGQPSVQIGIHSPMNSQQTLEAFYKAKGLDALQGLSIKVKNTKGKFNGFKGKLSDEFGTTGKTFKQKLLEWEPSDYDPKILDTVPADHLIVELMPYNKKKTYRYPLRVVRIIAEIANLRLLGLIGEDVKAVTRHLKIAPAERHRLALVVRESLVQFCQQFYPAIAISDNFSSVNSPSYFQAAKDLNFSTQLCFGNNVASVTKDTEMLPAIREFGLYKHASWYPERKTLRIAVIDTIPNKAHMTQRNEQLSRLKATLEGFGFTVERSADPIKIEGADPVQRRMELSSNLSRLIRSNPDIILVYLPHTDKLLRSDDPLSLYNTAKAVCIGAGIASQVIYEKTITETGADADANLIMGILGKTGNIPYVLDEPLEYVDVIVGLDIARKPTKNGGSLNTAAMSRVYTNNGALLGYAVSGSMLLDGETIPQAMLERILSAEEFGGKRVGLHRDGWFRGDELEKIMQWGKYIQAEFYPVEVIKSGAGRLYLENDKIGQASKGTAFLVDRNLAYLVSSPPPGRTPYSTANPLQVNNHSRLTQQQALHSVLALTLLHYGSVRPPRLPVSTHSSDKIAGFLLRNIQPDKQRGDVPFWL